MTIKAQIISGEFGKILARQKTEEELELGELLCVENASQKLILQVTELLYGSQLSQQNLELISGMNLDQNEKLSFFEPELRNYNLALMKPLVAVKESKARLCKVLPRFFSEAKEITKEDLSFLLKPKNSMVFGKLRSGSKLLDVDIALNGEKVLTHHILVAGTTGRGKSVLLSNILWNLVDKDYCGMLVLDPHDEYYGRNKVGLKDHPKRESVIYYTPKNPPAGARTLKINLKTIKPTHFDGVTSFSDPQKQYISAYYKKFRQDWINAALLEEELGPGYRFDESTIAVVKRKLVSFLNLSITEDNIKSDGVFDVNAGENTINDISSELENGKTVIIDTSSFSGSVEILIGSLITEEVFRRYRQYKIDGSLNDKPVVSVVLEEAPRVLGKEVLEQGPNIFSTIAREGRKFKVGLTAITQLPSLIPREILANMNTKIILGIEMAPERQAIIESASQDLSSDNRTIASLDVGEAIVTSNFSKFALPIKVPLFDDVVRGALEKAKEEKSQDRKTFKEDFAGVKTD